MLLDRLRNANPNNAYVMESFDVTALYTNVPNDSALQATHELLIQHQGVSCVELTLSSLKVIAVDTDQILGIFRGRLMMRELDEWDKIGILNPNENNRSRVFYTTPHKLSTLNKNIRLLASAINWKHLSAHT
ncbi:hypothetical protein KIN20_002838 [Parelaphostrongylus tenuis]|uniref:Reverse transcriptase domain-containing protein n=1 Tax=Parelaphostrongylus tenuis TaxID=148309 RepID=A0AAD5MES5_PARTN|nr:hypothetical protein KIN20_002838 [Parelaphostrongylus tenuis]